MDGSRQISFTRSDTVPVKSAAALRSADEFGAALCRRGVPSVTVNGLAKTSGSSIVSTISRCPNRAVECAR